MHLYNTSSRGQVTIEFVLYILILFFCGTIMINALLHITSTQGQLGKQIEYLDQQLALLVNHCSHKSQCFSSIQLPSSYNHFHLNYFNNTFIIYYEGSPILLQDMEFSHEETLLISYNQSYTLTYKKCSSTNINNCA